MRGACLIDLTDYQLSARPSQSGDKTPLLGVDLSITPSKPINRIFNIAVLGTFIPRRCGIATFTADLAEAMADVDPAVYVDAIAMSDQPYDYPCRVTTEVAVQDQLAYTFAAQSINRHGYDVLSVQHEYGIFGGLAGKYVLDLIRATDIPVVTTLHTVLRNPTLEQRAVMGELLELSARVVVMSRTAIGLLSQVYGVDLAKVDYIPHGIPQIPASAGAALRQEIGGEGPILLTFGLLSPDKGIENVIQALPQLIEAHPETKYLVVGATHPQVRASAGESYRESLIELAAKLGVSSHIEFVDEYVSLDRLVEYLSATDFYITPYLNPMQITSGTLAYSLGAGKVVISTPYEYAKEVLAHGRGIIVPFADPNAIADAVMASCACAETREKMGSDAAKYGSLMYWDRVGKLYLESFGRALEDSRCMPKADQPETRFKLPAIHFDHLEVLTDDTGILQHATFNVPNREEGYCVDDNARALLLTTLLESAGPLDPRLGRLQSTYLAFVSDAFDRKVGKFRNFMSYRREWLEAYGSEDSQGRALWALGSVASRSRNAGHSELASKLFDWAAPGLMETTSPRAWAYAAIGSAEILKREPGANSARLLLETMSRKLEGLFSANTSPDWPWLEGRLAYANARIPQALIVAGQVLERSELLNRGTQALRWLMDIQVSNRGYFSPVGAQGSGAEDLGTVQFDQQPIEACSSVSACLSAFHATGDTEFFETAKRCFEWFMGKNVAGLPLVDATKGSCFDGLLPDCVNRNQGAESTLSYLCALAEMQLAIAPASAPIRKSELQSN